MDDGNILATDGGRVLASQLGHNLVDHIHGQLAGEVQSGTRGNLGLGTVSSHLGAVGDIGAGVQHITGDGVQSQTSLAAQDLGSLQNGVVQSGQLQHIRLGDVVTVLSHSSGDGGHIQALAIRGDTFSQRSQSLGQAGELTELDGLTAALGNGALLGELIVDQVGLSLIQQGHVVESLHFHGQTGEQSGLQLICEQLQAVDNHSDDVFHGS